MRGNVAGLTLTRDALAVLAGVGGAHVILVASEAGVAVRAAAVEVALDVGAGAVGARAWHARVADLASEARIAVGALAHERVGRVGALAVVDARVRLAQVHVFAQNACVRRRTRAREGGAVRDALSHRVARVRLTRVADLAVHALEASRTLADRVAASVHTVAVLARTRLARVVALAALA